MADYISTNKRELILGIEGFSDVTPDTVLTLNGQARIKSDLKLIFGTASVDKLSLFYQSSDDSSRIVESGTGNLVIQADDLVLKNTADDETYASFINNGAVSLYYDDSIKFATTSTGATTTGIHVSDGFQVGDSEEIELGDAQDLKLYHDGTNSYIENDTGNLTISGTAGSNPGDTLTPLVINQTWNAGTDVVTGLSFNVTDTASGADSHLLDITIDGTSAFMIDKDISSASGTTIRTEGGVLTLARNTDGRVRHIFGNDSHIIKTSTGGTGIELNTPNRGILELGEKGSLKNQTFRIYRTDYSTADYERGYLSWISDTVFALGTEAGGTATASQMELQTDGTTRVTLTTDGIVRIPDNGKFTAGTSDDLQTYHDGTNSYIENATGDLYIRALTGEESIVTVPNAEVAAYYDNVRKVETTPTGIEVFGIVEADNITEHKVLNDISSLFNGVTTQFTISTGSPAVNFVNAEIPSEARLLISVGGIVQEPDPGQIKGYYISGGTNASTDPIKINFVEAPKANQTFFGVAFGLSFEPPNAFVTKEQAISYSIVFGGI